MKICKIHIRYLAGILPALVALSCSVDINQSVTPGGEDEVAVKFTIKLPAATPVSRALDESTDEYDVQQIDILAFNPEGGEFVYRNSYSAAQITGSGREKSFTATLRKGEFDIVLLANSHDAVVAAGLDGKAKTAALAALTATIPAGGKWVADASAGSYTPFPMWGDVGDITVDEDTDFSEDNAIVLARMSARVDVVIDPGVTRFKLTSVDVYNYNSLGSIVPAVAGSWDAAAGKAVAPVVPTGSVLTEGPISYTGDEVDAVNNRCAGEIYLFEAENHTVGAHAAGKALTDRTCVVMGGIFDANNDGNFTNDGEPTFYRMDFSTGKWPSETFLDVLRNHKYTLSVTKVSGPGYGDSHTAFITGPHNVEANVVPWNEAVMDDVEIDDYYFSFPNRNPMLPWEILSDMTITIKTNDPVFSIVNKEGTRTLRLGESYSSGNYIYELNHSGGDVYTLYIFTLNRNLQIVDDRLEEWVVKTSRLNIPFQVTQQWALWGGEADFLYLDAGNILRVGKYRNEDNSPGPANLSNMPFFKFGSVIGIKTPTDGRANFLLDDIVYNPSKLVVGADITRYGTGIDPALPDIPAFQKADYIEPYGPSVSSPVYHNGANIRNGRGDPCKLVGLDLSTLSGTEEEIIAILNTYDSGWRLPTSTENVYFVGGSYYTTAGWANWQPGKNTPFYNKNDYPYYDHDIPHLGISGDPHTVSVPVYDNALYKAYSQILPAAGSRGYNNNGNMNRPWTHASYWSSTPDDGFTSELSGDNTTLSVYTNVAYGVGLPIRCVRPSDIGLE